MNEKEYIRECTRALLKIEEAFSRMSFSQRQTMKLLGVGKSRVKRLMKEGELTVVQNGDCDNSTWECSGKDLYRIITQGKQNQVKTL